MSTSRIMVTAGVIVLILLLFLALLVDSIPADHARQLDACALLQCRIYLVLRDFQTMLGAAAALLAAYLAAKPVWQQLRRMAVQQDIMAREIILGRLQSIQKKSRYLEDEVSRLSHGIFWSIHDHGDEDEPIFNARKAANPSWADSQAGQVSRTTRELENHQSSMSDTTAIENARRTVISELQKLYTCLDNISAPGRFLGDPELTDDILADLHEKAARAANELPSILGSIDGPLKTYRAVAEDEIRKIRHKIRSIDDEVLSRE